MRHIHSRFSHAFAGYAVVSTKPAERLIVFIHGWRGDAAGTWGEFAKPPADEWWAVSDLLFVDYDSTSESVVATADRIRARIKDFYPVPNGEMLVRRGVAVRENWEQPYRELIIVGHSLGGLVARRAVVDAIDEWKGKGFDAVLRPPILDAHLRLFSPASAGFLPRGFVGACQAAPLWWVVEMFLRRGGAYLDLQPGSATITSTKEWTEAYEVGHEHASALAASLLWANPEKVVATERYATDAQTRTADGTDHGSVCKPNAGYSLPYHFVKTGDTE